VATESSLNPLALIVHLLALAAGLFGGWQAMSAITPDLPGEGTEPGVTAVASATQVAGDDPNSLLRAAPLAGALEQLDEQLAAGEGIVRLRIEPGQVDVESASTEGVFEPTEVDPSTPERMVERIEAQRAEVGGLGDIQYMELVATDAGPEWYVQLVSTNRRINPPWTYGAPLSGAPLKVGGAPPQPVSE
jgi:hypothetical protein